MKLLEDEERGKYIAYRIWNWSLRETDVLDRDKY
jgi:hypothetical protein